ncbi:pupal cuticle protein 36 [Plutella xylostella]|uniref:pupal cuticle protein 36 n=1 Tax=Plutella xylostella TaxID=51655 RepID=UPI002032A03E|nr:pupal cuticle protein 36 [Plutella xylostella]
MKLFIVAAVLGVASAARLDNTYLPPRGNSGSGASTFGGAGFGQASGFGQSSGFGQKGGFGQGGSFSGNAYNAPASTRQQSSFEANAQILKYNNEVTAEGFSYDFETSNGIRADARGVATNGVQSQGSFGYKGDDGQDYSITYTADENGYRPVGAHLPTPPPIPEAILKSLEQNARDEAAGITDDGTYRGEGAGSGYSSQGGYSAPSGPSTQYGAPARGFQGSQGGFQGAQAGFQGAKGGFQGAQGGFQGAQGGFRGNQGSGFQSKGSFGGATSRQYLTPNAGPKPGSGSFNQQTGYQY